MATAMNLMFGRFAMRVGWRRLPTLFSACPSPHSRGHLTARHCSSVSTSTDIYVPRRAVLYVPGNDAAKLQKIPTLDVDCAVLDCEDGVALNKKEDARHMICEKLDELDFGRTDVVVRVNSVGSGLAEQDLEVTLQAKRLPNTLMLPKVEQVEHIDWFAQHLGTVLKGRSDFTWPHFIIFVESAIGLLNLNTICQRAIELTELGAPFKLDGIVFGSDDFCADIGASRTADAHELLYARQNIVTVAKAFRLQAIDLVHIDYKDLDSLKEQALEGAKMGFTGKQVIHPSQIPIVQDAFTPSQEKQEWAAELIKAFNEHQESGQGAFTFRESMIDMPLVLQAQNIVKLSEAIAKSKATTTTTTTTNT